MNMAESDLYRKKLGQEERFGSMQIDACPAPAALMQ